jgi:peptidoglycan/LPS O-acetylase OafA/YrhL
LVATERQSIPVSAYKVTEGASVTLDLIRLISAQLVIIGHTIQGLEILPFLQPPFAPYMQNVAVAVFFVLSGFLISYTVFSRHDRPDYDFRTYFIDRFSRIYCGYLPAIVFIIIVDSINIRAFGLEGFAYAEALDLKTIIGNVFMLQDYPVIGPIFSITSLGSARVLWTLAVEWWIYMAFGWLALNLPLCKKRPVFFWVILTFTSVVPLWNLVSGRGHGLTMMWLIGLAIYVVLSRDLLPKLSSRSAFLLSLVCFALALVRVFATKEAYDVLFALLLGAALCLLIVSVKDLTYTASIKRLIRLLANYSFTLYLIHLTIYALVTRWVEANGMTVSPYLLLVGIFVVCNVIALALAWFTEMRHKTLASWFKNRI